ncbi:hypothetical protein STEG23_028420 [Scotinomys teguina]
MDASTLQRNLGGYPGDFMADGLHQLTLSSQSLGFGTPAAPVQVRQHSRPPRSSRTVSTSAQLELCSLPEANCHSGSVPLVCRTCPQVSGSKVSHRRYCLTSCLRPVAMGNILQRSSPEVKNLTQFSLLKGLRNYLPSPVERVLRASASLWPFDNRPWSLRPRSPISNQDAQQELDTTPKSLEYLTINKAKTDLAVQRQLPQPTPKLKCRESHGKPGKNSRGVKIPDSGSGDSRCNHTGAEETTDSQVTSDHIKELSQDKRKGSLSVEVPETMKNTLSRDSMRSTFHPVIRKRPGSSFVPRPEKEKRSLDMSLLLEECVDCCALCSGLAARSSGSRAGDTKPKMKRNDAVPTGTSSSQQRGLVNSPSTQISLKPARSTKQVLRNSKSVSGDRLTSTLAQGLQRPSKYLEGAHKWPSPVKRRLKQDTSEQGHESTPPTVHLGSGLPVSDPQGTSSVTLSQGGITPGTSDEWDPDLIVHSLESVDRSSSSDQAQGTHANTGGVLAKLTHEEGALVTRISLTGNIQLYRKCRSNVHS